MGSAAVYLPKLHLIGSKVPGSPFKVDLKRNGSTLNLEPSNLSYETAQNFNSEPR